MPSFNAICEMQSIAIDDCLERQRTLSIESASTLYHVSPPSQSSPQLSVSSATSGRTLIRPPPGFPVVPQYAPAPAPAPPPQSLAINTSPPAPQRRHFKIVELHWGYVNFSWTTAFLLVDAQTGHLFHGTLPCAPWLQSFLASGLNVTDFRVGNQPIRPISSTYLYPHISEGKGLWHRYTPSTISLLSRRTSLKTPLILPFTWTSRSPASRLRAEITICEIIRSFPSPHLAEYKGVQVDTWGRVTGLTYKSYTSHLLAFARAGYLRMAHLPGIRTALLKAVTHLQGLGIKYGIVGPENVYLTYIWHQGSMWVREVVLGDFENAVSGEGRVGREEVEGTVERETVWGGRMVTAELERVFRVGTELPEGIELDSIVRLEGWMRSVLGL